MALETPPCAYWAEPTDNPLVTAEHMRLATTMFESESWCDTPVEVVFDVIRTSYFARRCNTCSRCALGGYNVYWLAELLAADMSLLAGDDSDATDAEQYAFLRRIGPQYTSLHITNAAHRVAKHAPALLDALHVCDPWKLALYGSLDNRTIVLDALCDGPPLTRTKCLVLNTLTLDAAGPDIAQRLQTWLPSLMSVQIWRDVVLRPAAAAALMSPRLTKLHLAGDSIHAAAPHLPRLTCLTHLALQIPLIEAGFISAIACMDAVRAAAPPLQSMELDGCCDDVRVLRAVRATVLQLPSLRELHLTLSCEFGAYLKDIVRVCVSVPAECHITMVGACLRDRSPLDRLASILRALRHAGVQIHASDTAVVWWDVTYDAALMRDILGWVAAHRRGPVLLRRALRRDRNRTTAHASEAPLQLSGTPTPCAQGCC